MGQEIPLNRRYGVLEDDQFADVAERIVSCVDQALAEQRGEGGVPSFADSGTSGSGSSRRSLAALGCDSWRSCLEWRDVGRDTSTMSA